jgi:hypothetical protein
MDRNGRLQLTQANLIERRTGAPPQIKDFQELMDFVGRIYSFTSEFFPRSQLYSSSKRARAHLRKNKSLYKSAEWMKHGPADLIVWFRQIEELDFSKVCTSDELIHPDCVFTEDSGVELPLFSQICQTGAHYPNDTLPPGLKVQVTPRQEPRDSKRSAPTAPAANGGSAPRANSASGERPAKKVKPTPQTYTNPDHNHKFKAYWAGAPADFARKSMVQILKGANTTVARVLDSMDAGHKQCGMYHIKGSCNANSFCARTRLNHDPKPISDELASAAIALFEQVEQRPAPRPTTPPHFTICLWPSHRSPTRDLPCL